MPERGPFFVTSIRAKSRFPKLLKTLETKIREGTIGEDSGSLQAGGHRFDPGHVHQLNSRSLNYLRSFFYCTILVQFRYIRYNWSFWKFKAEANFSRFLQPHIKLFA